MRRSIVLAVLAVIQALVFGAAAAVVVVAVTTAPAQAQTAQTPRPFTLPQCRPAALGGPGTGFAVYEGREGICAGYWCPDATKTSGWAGWQWCAIPGYAMVSIGAATAALAAQGPMSDESYREWLRRNQQAPTPAGVPFYNALHSKMDVAMAATRPAPPPPPPPPAPAWVVDAATAADGTRPAFALVNGVRASTSTARAAAGQPCRPEVAQAPSGVAGKVFAAYGPSFSPALVALCRKP